MEFPAAITLTSDFRLSDSYVAEMKGAILSLCSGTSLIDICHEVPHGDIYSGAQLIRDASCRFPPDTIHLAVVDPGVGTDRKRIIIEAEIGEKESRVRAKFVGPDNGLFSLAVDFSRLLGVWQILNIDLLPPVSMLSTFDGRDIFAPTAALLAKGVSPDQFGPSADPATLVQLRPPRINRLADGSIEGQVVYIDSFGNALSNVSISEFDSLESIQVCAAKIPLELQLVKAYEDIGSEQAAALVNSRGVLEIACKQCSAAERYGLEVGDQIIVKKSAD